MKKFGIVAALIICILITACAFAGCEDKDGFSIEKIVIDGIEYSSEDWSCDETGREISFTLKSQAQEISADAVIFADGVSCRLYLDENLTEEIEESVGFVSGLPTVVYAKAWKKKEKNFVVFRLEILKLCVIPPDGGNTDDDKPTDKPVKDDILFVDDETKGITAKEIIAVIGKYIEDNDSLIDFLYGADGEILISAFRKGDITKEQLISIESAAGEDAGAIIEALGGIFADGEFPDAKIDKSFVESAFNVFKAVRATISAEQMRAALPYLTVSAMTVVYPYTDGRENTNSYDIGKVAFENLFSEEIRQNFDKYFGLTLLKRTEIVMKTAEFNTVSQATSAFADKICEIDAKEIADFIKTAVKISASMDTGTDFVDSGDVSYTELAKFFNVFGKIIEAFTVGAGDGEEFESALSRVLTELSKISDGFGRSVPAGEISASGLKGAAEFFAAAFKGIDEEFIGKLYELYDGYNRAEESGKAEFKGRAVVEVCKFISPYFATLGDESLCFMKRAAAYYDIGMDIPEMKKLVARAADTEGRELTAEEYAEFAETAEIIFAPTEISDRIDFSVDGTPFIALGSDVNAVYAVLKRAGLTVYTDGNAIDDWTVEEFSTENEGFSEVAVGYGGDTVKIKVYVYAVDSYKKFAYVTDFSTAEGRTFPKGGMTEADIVNSFKDYIGIRNFGYFIMGDSGNIYPSGLDIDWKNAEIIDFDNGTVGERGAFIKVSLGGFSDAYMPFVYNVFEEEKEKITDFEVFVNGSEDGYIKVIQNEKAEFEGRFTYEYCRTEEPFKISAEDIAGFDISRIGKQTVVITVNADGKDYIKKLTVEVLSFEEARRIEDYYLSDLSYYDGENYYGADELPLGVSPESLIFDGYLSFKVESAHFSTFDELKNLAKKYRYGVKLNIDTAEAKENASYSVVIEDENGETVLVLGEGLYSIKNKEESYVCVKANF